MSSIESRSAMADALRRVPRPVTLFAALFLALLLAYAPAHFTFLRAETGYFQMSAAHGLNHSLFVIYQDWIQHSNNGHFKPIGIAIEFICVWLFGTTEWAWRLRQVLVLALLCTTFWSLLWRTATIVDRPWLRAAVPLAVALYALQPQMTDFVTWPQTYLYIVSLTFGLLATSSLVLVDFADPSAMRRAVWYAAGFSYLSINFLGNGMVFVGATIMALVLVAYLARPGGFIDPTVRRPALYALGTLVFVAAIHGSFMANIHPNIVVHGTVNPSQLLTTAAGFLARMVEHFFGFWVAPVRYFRMPAADQVKKAAWAGGVILAVFAVFVAYGIGILKNPSRRRLSLYFLYLFGVIGFLGQAALVVFRLRHQESADLYPLYIIGPRYIALYSIFLIVIAFVAAAALPNLQGFARKASKSVATVALVACSVQFALLTFVYVPRFVSHQRYDSTETWAVMKAMVVEMNAAGEPIPNIDIAWLMDFPFRLNVLEPLILKELAAPPSTPLAWRDPALMSPGDWAEARRRFPTLDRFMSIRERV